MINAQVEGGYTIYSDEPERALERKVNAIMRHGEKFGGGSILHVLLDTEGAKAAYGEILRCENCMRNDSEECFCESNESRRERFKIVTDFILEGWHDSNGNNWKEAIDTAYSLLSLSYV